MKNKEKYKDKILDIALQHDVVAVDKNNNSVEPCGEIPSCDYCLFRSDDDWDSCDDEKFIKWLEEEANENTPIKPPINDDDTADKDEEELSFDKLECDSNACGYRWLYELDDEEDGFLKIVEGGYITRNIINNEIVFHDSEPIWKDRTDYLNKGYWFSPFNNIRLKTDSFKFIKAGECWAYNTDTKAINKDVIYNITKDLREDID